MTAGLAIPLPPKVLLAATQAGFGFWRMIWIDLPLEWLAQVDRAAAAIAAAGGPTTTWQAVALGLGCDATATDAQILTTGTATRLGGPRED